MDFTGRAVRRQSAGHAATHDPETKNRSGVAPERSLANPRPVIQTRARTLSREGQSELMYAARLAMSSSLRFIACGAIIALFGPTCSPALYFCNISAR